ncbi:major facilitator family transporter [Nocardioidaceae bacterium Broad-1]|nr:major facilitator family transporter [Nocardioidaceae bacterium Broad-1]
MNLRARIDAAAMTPYQWMVVALCVLLNCLDGFDVMAMAFTASSLTEEFALSGSELGVLLSAGLVGMAVGSLALAPVADVIGRRPLILISVGLATVGMLLSAAAPSALLLGLARVVTGLGVGGILASTNVIASEYASARWRGLAIGLYTAGYGIGATLGGVARARHARRPRLAQRLRRRRRRDRDRAGALRSCSYLSFATFWLGPSAGQV